VTAASRLRERLAADGLVVCPGVVNALFARQAERAGFEALYATGAGIANAHLGVPDLGLLTMSELLEIDRRIALSVEVPVIADADTGYGGALNVFRTVREFAAAGLAAVQIEDQVNPKRCGHFAGKQVVGLEEMLERLVAATEARGDGDVVLVARTDARATHGLDEALRRATAFVEAGADLVFVEAPETLDELRLIPREVPAPVLINVVEGGRTPVPEPGELEAMGYRVALYANAALRVAAAATERALAVLRRTGGTAGLEMLGWDARQALVDLDGWSGLADAVAGRASALAAREEDF
jgi:2-methylisocitrate lyase-like PEP mutase family enzyme